MAPPRGCSGKTALPWNSWEAVERAPARRKILTAIEGIERHDSVGFIDMGNEVTVPKTAFTRMGRTACSLLTIAVLTSGAVGHTASASVNDENADVSAVVQRQTQEMLDAIARGDREPWNRYLHDAMIYAAEDGSVKTKSQLLEELRPFPKEIWGKLHIRQFRAVHHDSTVVANYIIDEEEGYFGQVIHSRYLATDTWIRTPGGWRLVASEALALRTDPPAIDLPPGRLDEYVGVYALTPEMSYTIRRGQKGLEGQRTGRKPETLKAELVDCLFVPGEPRLRKVFQRDGSGTITGFVERRESWDIRWRRTGAAPGGR